MSTDKEYAILVIDLETTIKNRGDYAIGKDKASPHHPDNKIVYYGHKTKAKDFKASDVRVEGISPDGPYDLVIPDRYEEILIIGQNVKFDLLYLMRSEGNKGLLKRCSIWDTQLAEYLLTAHSNKYASLGDKKDKHGEVVKKGLATTYGGTDKDDKIKEYWDNDIDTELIPRDEIEEYLKYDVLNTELVATTQMKLAEELGILPLMKANMEALLATTEMEFNGLYFDKDAAMRELTKLVGTYGKLKTECLYKFFKVLEPEIEINYNSNEQLSAIFFGGKLKYTQNVAVCDPNGDFVKYKTGNRKGEIKYKKETFIKTIPGLISPNDNWKTKKEGVYKVDDEVLETILLDHLFEDAGLLADYMQRFRALSKEINTYYKPYIKLVFPDGCIHGKLNHCATNTGRLASSSPNLQNITNKGYEEDE